MIDYIYQAVKKSSSLQLDRKCLERAFCILYQDWNLDDTDDFFQCMTEEEFKALKPVYQWEEADTYEQVEPPVSSAPINTLERERCACAIERWFMELRRRKLGVGCVWPNEEEGAFWVPVELLPHENRLYNGYRGIGSVPYEILQALTYTSRKRFSHLMYHIYHAIESQDGVLLRTEVEILIEGIKSQMKSLLPHPSIVPVSQAILILSLHDQLTIIRYFCSPFIAQRPGS